MNQPNKLADKLAAVRTRPTPPLAAPVAPAPPAVPPENQVPFTVNRQRKKESDRWDSRVRRATFYIDVDLLDRLGHVTDRTGRNKSDLVRDALDSYLRPFE